MPRLRHPVTGKVAIRIRTWFEIKGESPTRPMFVRRWSEDRYVAVPGNMVEEGAEPWSIETEAGFTDSPLP